MEAPPRGYKKQNKLKTPTTDLFLKPNLGDGYLGFLRVGFLEQVVVMLQAWVAADYLPNPGFSWVSRLFRGSNSCSGDHSSFWFLLTRVQSGF